MRIQITNAKVNPVWKWIVSHDDVNAELDPKRYVYISQLCRVFFGPEDTSGMGWTDGRWVTGKMGWKFRKEEDALELKRMIESMFRLV